MVEHPLIVLWDVGSISYGGHIELLLNDWYNKGHGMCCPVCRILDIKNLLLPNKTISPYTGGSMFLLKSLIFYDYSSLKY